MVIQPGHALEDPFGGIHHLYANALAMQELQSGGYTDGAAFVGPLRVQVGEQQAPGGFPVDDGEPSAYPMRRRRPTERGIVPG